MLAPSFIVAQLLVGSITWLTFLTPIYIFEIETGCCAVQLGAQSGFSTKVPVIIVRREGSTYIQERVPLKLYLRCSTRRFQTVVSFFGLRKHYLGKEVNTAHC